MNSQPHSVHGSGNSCTHMASPASMEQKPHQPAANFSIDRKCESHSIYDFFKETLENKMLIRVFSKAGLLGGLGHTTQKLMMLHLVLLVPKLTKLVS